MSEDVSTRLAVGMLVTASDPRTPGLFKIVNRGPKNWTITPVNADGTARPGKGARFPAYVLTEVTDPAAAATTTAVGIPYVPRQIDVFWPGTIVRFGRDNQLYVVIADKGDKVNIARLGGDDGRYWRAQPVNLTIVPLADLPAAL